MYKLEDIKAVHLEMTEKCNLSCLMCDRNKNGEEVNQYLEGRSLSFKDIHKSFPPSFIKKLKKVYMCGNYGDPILAPDTLQAMKYFRSHNKDMFLEIITNGCACSTTWWRDLAKVVDVVRFSIDGLEDTHKIYRRKAVWSVIIRNAKAFIEEGGHAVWDYLVFGHNEHQVEEARKLSEELGFKEFVVKKTGRFFSNVQLKGKDEHAGVTKPKESKNINKSLQKEQKIIEKYGNMENYLDQVEVDCKVLKNKEIYISAEGLVFPCCWLAGQMYKWYLPPESTQMWDIVNKYNINIKENTLSDIIESGYLDQIKDSWRKISVEDGKLKTCALKCGVELDQFGDQYK